MYNESNPSLGYTDKQCIPVEHGTVTEIQSEYESTENPESTAKLLSKQVFFQTECRFPGLKPDESRE